MSQKILITGTSSGFGKLATKTLLKAGHNVVASMRDPDGRNETHAEELKNDGAHVVEIDVTNDESVKRGVEKTISLAGGIDVLINNAGVGVVGLQETFTVEDWTKLFEINVFGVQRMNRAVLPHLRAQKSGLLIHISSLLGRFVIPFFGPYNASKYALEALADNYRIELAAAGVESVIVEPGAYGTDFAGRLIKASDTDRLATYGELAKGPEQMMAGFESNMSGPTAPDPQQVADAILKLVDTPRGQRPFRTVVDELGMGVPIKKYNEAADQASASIYSAFGMDGMLKLQ